MAQRTSPSGARGSGPATGSRPAGSRRTKPAPVNKPFPWGFVLGSAVLAVVLIGIVAFAVVKQGSAATGTLARADQVSGIVKTDIASLKRNHVQGVVAYPDRATTPPVGGDHNPLPETCQVYTQQIPDEHAIHSLEHGAAWVTYRPDLPAGEVAALAKLVQGNPYRLMSPYPGLKRPISVQAWGRQIFADKASDGRIASFLKNFTNGPSTPERGATCTGSTQTGPTPAANPDGAPKG